MGSGDSCQAGLRPCRQSHGGIVLGDEILELDGHKVHSVDEATDFDRGPGPTCVLSSSFSGVFGWDLGPACNLVI